MAVWAPVEALFGLFCVVITFNGFSEGSLDWLLAAWPPVSHVFYPSFEGSLVKFVTGWCAKLVPVLTVALTEGSAYYPNGALSSFSTFSVVCSSGCMRVGSFSAGLNRSSSLSSSFAFLAGARPVTGRSPADPSSLDDGSPDSEGAPDFLRLLVEKALFSDGSDNNGKFFASFLSFSSLFCRSCSY